ncbi:GNAT family N-acetyltransferase [Fictibacillus aquaticus]|uniref:GNAT family N-acetyltransferase n=1 Tax=Fictibacillus aquaticus TaxID=2021314 RepID=A0A235F790_9BACL|nr:GNAT family protein [Fictibacillus aquaticus]OYD57201.1 GNAT family N-acetyltransferase [Fictibacillus aquaticus]
MNQAPVIQGKSVILRQPIESDILDRFACGRSIEAVRMYGGDTRNVKPLTMEGARGFFERIKANKLEWCVEYEGRCIGQARLTVNEDDCRARYAIGLFDTSVWGKGLGTEITQLVLEYAFEGLKLHRVDLRVLEYNHRAIACYEKCGFVKEGVEREGALIEGKYETDVFMSILDREYVAIKSKAH